ncbi:MAG: fused MFS/spermidine synthase [Actinomycetota bacterium]
MYYTRAGPVGDVVRASGDRLARAGVIGLGTGSMACFSEPGEEWVFFEIDPLVVRIASDPDLFTYLSACAEQVEIVVGDGRQTLAREPASSFDLLVVDAFSGDAIPMHLLTREAFDLYLSRLQPDGLLALHISNRYLDLAPVVGRVTQETGATGMLRFDRPSEDRLAQGATPSIWVVIARDHEALGPLQDDGRWAPLEPGHDGAWTDDYSSILDALR